MGLCDKVPTTDVGDFDIEDDTLSVNFDEPSSYQTDTDTVPGARARARVDDDTLSVNFDDPSSYQTDTEVDDELSSTESINFDAPVPTRAGSFFDDLDVNDVLEAKEVI